MFAFVGHRPRTVQRVMLGAGNDGALVAVTHDVTSHTSRFDEFMEPSAYATRMLYACPNLKTSHRLVRLDLSTPTFMRAPGEASGSFALESAMDELAWELGMDPIALRLKNHADRDPEDGRAWSSKSLKACYQRGAERFGWARRKRAVRATKEGDVLVGVGMATATYPARQIPSEALARAMPDGTFVVQAATHDLGTGTYTIMTQIAAEALGVPIEKVRFELGDTALPEAPISAGSMTASSVGSAVRRASQALRARLDGTSGPITQPIEERVRETEAPDRKDWSVHSFGAHFVEVRVDERLGTIRVARVVSAFGAGKILNAKTGGSQLMGGVVWGIGFALEEDTVRDPRTGRLVTKELADYHVPVNADVPEIDIITVDEDDPHVNPMGAKGIGEIGVVGLAAAIANAVFHATGVRVRELPIRLDKFV
jgi:xanthine dehydrogenase YagR molybdenum-binding subunit